MIRYLILCFLLTYSAQKDFELNIYKYSLKENTLILYFCIKNNTDSLRTFVETGYSTFPYIQSFTLYIIENDTLPLHIQNPESGFLARLPDYKAIEPYDSICAEYKILLNELYTFDKMVPNPPHQIEGRCSFQFVYRDKYVRRGISHEFKAFGKDEKKIKNHKPISDSLYSNIIYIPSKKEGNVSD